MAAKISTPLMLSTNIQYTPTIDTAMLMVSFPDSDINP